MVILTERFQTQENRTLLLLLLFGAETWRFSTFWPTTNVMHASVQLIVKKFSKIFFSALGRVDTCSSSTGGSGGDHGTKSVCSFHFKFVH